LDKLNNKACRFFEKVVEGLVKQGAELEEASLLPSSIKGFLFYVGNYKIKVQPRRKVCWGATTLTKVKAPTKKQIKETPKKVYKKAFKKQARDSKGRFKKGK